GQRAGSRPLRQGGALRRLHPLRLSDRLSSVIAVLFGVVLARLGGVMGGMLRMAVGRMGVMGGLLVGIGLMMLGRLAMMLGCMLRVLGGSMVVLHDLVLGHRPLRGRRRPLRRSLLQRSARKMSRRVEVLAIAAQSGVTPRRRCKNPRLRRSPIS